MAQPAIRNTDIHLCVSHGAEAIGAAARLDITVNNQAGLHVGVGFTCGGQTALAVSGASTVQYHGEFASRAFDDSSHGGKLVIGSRNVVIGGPQGMGAIGAGKGACQAMAAGRTSGQARQSYGNCVLESARQLIRRATGNKVTEDELLNHALGSSLCVNSPSTPTSHGGSDGEKARQLLGDYGVPAERMPAEGPATLGAVKQALAEGRGVMAFVDPHEISPALYPSSACHAVVVTGVELDKDGHVTAVFLNDSGAGECGKKVPAAAFGAGLRNLPSERASGGAKLLVTKGAVP